MWAPAPAGRRVQNKGRRRDRRPPPPMEPPPGGYRLLVLVGIPGSGKSTFASFLSGMGWDIVNQDTLGSRQACEAAAQHLLLRGGRVVIDRCNFDKSQRFTWTDLAASLSIRREACVAVWLDIPLNVCHERVQLRTGHRTLQPGRAAADVVTRMARLMRPPERREGFHDVLHCRGDSDLSDAVAVLSSIGVWRSTPTPAGFVQSTGQPLPISQGAVGQSTHALPNAWGFNGTTYPAGQGTASGQPRNAAEAWQALASSGGYDTVVPSENGSAIPEESPENSIAALSGGEFSAHRDKAGAAVVSSEHKAPVIASQNGVLVPSLQSEGRGQMQQAFELGYREENNRSHGLPDVSYRPRSPVNVCNGNDVATPPGTAGIGAEKVVSPDAVRLGSPVPGSAIVDGSAANGGGGGLAEQAARSSQADELRLSEGEAFVVLDDMFGGLLSPGTLATAYEDSGHRLEEAVQRGFKACKEVWDIDEGYHEAADVASEPSTGKGSTDRGRSRSRSGDGGIADGLNSWLSLDEFADVTEWTDEQVSTLTELCLALEGTPREEIMAALVTSNHDAASAAQLLLEASSPDAPVAKQTGKKRRRRTDRRGGGRSLTPPASGAAAFLLGVTCGDRPRSAWDTGPGDALEAGGGGGPGGGGGHEEGEEEEEEGDEGLSSEQYRARADAAAEQMRFWFQKAAKAYTTGGRNGGAAAAHPSEVGQRWKRRMEAINLRAAREVFRERNPSIKVGPAADEKSVLKVLALPEPSRCPVRGRLSVDLHLLRRAEAVSVLEAVLVAVKPRALSGAARDRSRSPTVPQGRDQSGGRGNASAWDERLGESTGVVPRPLTSSSVFGREAFSSLEVVVGRGAHSDRGVARLRPIVTKYLASKGFRTQGAGGDFGEGVVVVRLR